MGTFTAGREADWQNGMHDFWHQMEVPDPVDQEEKHLVKLHPLEIIIEITVEITVRSHWHFKTSPLLQFENVHIAVYIVIFNIWRNLISKKIMDDARFLAVVMSPFLPAKLPTMPRCGA